MADADEILALYRSVIGTPFCVWNENYPGQPEVDADIVAGTLYITTEAEKIMGAISIVPLNELDHLAF